MIQFIFPIDNNVGAQEWADAMAADNYTVAAKVVDVQCEKISCGK